VARSTLTAVLSTKAGAVVTPVSADSAGSQWVYGRGKNHLIVQNTDSSSHNVTLRVPATVDGDLDVPDRIVAVAANTVAVINESQSERQTDGNVYVDYSSTTGMKVRLIQVP
jgi:hypothetical protein